MTTKRVYIKVPSDAVRTREQILDGLTIIGLDVWSTCWNCGGTGDYPSPATPAGRCRLYCWLNRTEQTFGKLPIRIEQYVKQSQKSDRAAYRNQIRMKMHDDAVAERITNVDARIAKVVDALKIDVKNLPVVQRMWEGKREIFVAVDANNSRLIQDGSREEWLESGRKVSKSFEMAISIIEQYLAKGQLSDRQWEMIAIIPEREAEYNARQSAFAAQQKLSRHLGEIGKKIEFSGRVVFVSETYQTRFGPSVLYKFVSNDGAIVDWWTSFADVKKGDVVEVEARVKKHTDYKGTPVTVIKNAKVRVF